MVEGSSIESVFAMMVSRNDEFRVQITKRFTVMPLFLNISLSLLIFICAVLSRRGESVMWRSQGTIAVKQRCMQGAAAVSVLYYTVLYSMRECVCWLAGCTALKLGKGTESFQHSRMTVTRSEPGKYCSLRKQHIVPPSSASHLISQHHSRWLSHLTLLLPTCQQVFASRLTRQ